MDYFVAVCFTGFRTINMVRGATVAACDATRRYLPSMVSASRLGASETPITPSNGVFISRIRNIAPEVDSAPRNNAAMTVGFAGANRPNAEKITENHNTSDISNGTGVEPQLAAS